MSKKSDKGLPLVSARLVSLIGGGIIGVGMAITALTGCHQTDQSKQLDELRTRVNNQSHQLDIINQALLRQDAVVSRFEFTEFDPTAVRYFSLNNGVMSLIGQVVQIKPQAEGKGSAITLRIVNSGSVTVFNPGFMAQWGSAMPIGDKVTVDELQQWRKTLRSSEFRGQMRLAPNDWTEITLPFKEVAPDQLHYVKFSMLMDQVQFEGALTPARTVQQSAPVHP